MTAPDGTVSESATANIGFFRGSGVVWPDAPLLHGITMQLLERTLDAGSLRATVRVADIPSFDGAFLSNARGIGAVSRIDEMRLPMPAERMTMLLDAYASVPWDVI